jgi:hypothetical protein
MSFVKTIALATVLMFGASQLVFAQAGNPYAGGGGTVRNPDIRKRRRTTIADPARIRVGPVRAINRRDRRI